MGMIPEIVIDARWLRLGGLGTYTYNLVTRFAKCTSGLKIRIIAKRKDVGELSGFCDNVSICDAAMYTVREQLEIPRVSRGGDLLHVLHYNAPIFHVGPMLVSIHDLIHITEPVHTRTLASWIYARPLLMLAVRKAAHIITVSDYSKKQIIQLLRVPASKVTSIHCGVSEKFHPIERGEARAAISRAFGIEEPYILYVGNLKPHKNVSTLFRAFASLRERGSLSHRLLVVGDDGRWGPIRHQECAALCIEPYTTFIRSVDSVLLPALYSAADLVVMPSKSEGFGLPVLEAMACGTPVICSRAASLPEVAGDAALYFDPLSSVELASAIGLIIGSRDLQRSLSLKGLNRAKQFRWDDSVRKHVELYRRFSEN